MIQVYTAQALHTVGFVKSLLACEGIDSMIRNEHLNSAMGELPPIECWPELWILNDQDESRARTIVENFQKRADSAPGPAWHCQQCGEFVEGEFDLCWNCQTERPG